MPPHHKVIDFMTTILRSLGLTLSILVITASNLCFAQGKPATLRHAEYPIPLQTLNVSMINDSSWTVTPDTLYMGRYYGMPDTGVVTITNLGPDTISAQVTHFKDYFGWDYLNSGGGRIPGYSSGVVNIISGETAGGIMRVFAGDGFVDIPVFGNKSAPPRDSLRWYGTTAFGSITPGATAHAVFTITNQYDTAVTLTSLAFPQGSPYSFDFLTALPRTLGPSSGIDVGVAFVAPQEAGISANSFVRLEYAFGGVKDSQLIPFSGASLTCYDMSTDSIGFGPVIRDQTAKRKVILTNQKDASIELALSLDPATQGFSILTGSPLTIGALDSAEVEVQFLADGPASQQTKLTIEGENCGWRKIPLSAAIDDSTIVVDANSIPLYGDEERTLTFEGDSSDLSERYVFYNNQADTITILSVALKHGTHFTIEKILPRYPELKLDSGEAIGVVVSFDNEPGTYADTLIIVTETGIVALDFPMVALIHGTSSVHSSPVSKPRMSVTPNPGAGPITISLSEVKSASLEVLDIMGKSMLQLKGVSTVVDGNDLAAGSYFIRASGIDINGKPFVVTQRLVIAQH
jgi:hypothetical protein